MTEQTIGAARVHLIVDADDYNAAIARATNTARGFGNDAEQAFDKSTGGVRRAAKSLLDYVSNLGKSSEQLRILRAAQQGVDRSIIDAAAAAMADYRQQTETAAEAARDLARAQDEASRINAAFDQSRGANFRQGLEDRLGINSNASDLSEQRAIIAQLTSEADRYAQELAAVHGEALAINTAFDQQKATLAQLDINRLVAPGLSEQASTMGATIDALTADFVRMDATIDEAFAHNTQIDRFRQQLENIASTAGKTHYELLQMKADQLGVGDSFRPLIKGIQDQDKAMGHAGISAKQYEWAMRGLPAQITDIAVSLVSGQPAYLVALQQGGQIKDMFGGIVPAARALGSALLGLVNPWTIAASAIALAGYAAFDAARSMEDLAIAVAKGDQIAGTTREMYALAGAINEIKGVNLGSAEDAVARLASGGKLAGENFELAAQATARWAAITGESVDTVASKFEAIAKGPLEAIESGQIRVTEAQYKHIKSLVETGQHQQAVNDLVKIYFDTMNANSDMVQADLSATSKVWGDIKDTVGEVTRAIGDATNAVLGFTKPVIDAYLAMVRLQYVSVGRLFKFGAAGGIFAGQDFSDVTSSVVGGGGNTGSNLYDPDEAKRTKERADALAQWTATADKAAQRELQLNKIRAEGDRLGQSKEDIDKVVARQEQLWREQDAKAGSRGGQGRDGTQAIRDQAAAEIAAITTQTKLLQSQYDQRQISVEDYYDKLQGYANDELAVTLRSIEAQKAAVAGRNDAANRIAQLESQAARAREQNAARGIELSEAERKAVQQRENAYEDYVRALDKSNEAAQRNADLEVARVGMGQEQYRRMVAMNDLLRRRTELEDDLAKRQARGELEAKDAERYTEALVKVNEQIGIMIDGWAREDEAQSSAMAGMTRAWQDWLDQTADAASQWASIFNDTIGGAVDNIADALAGNETNWDNYLQNIHTKILQFIVQEQLTKWLKSLGESLSGAEGEGLWGSLARGIGSIFSGATKNAQGGVYSGAGIGAYRNSIVSQPTFFPFARGGVPNMGLMGERSGKPHEAIMPLTRTNGGDLGVRVVESGQRGPISLNQQFIVQGTPDRTTREQMAKKAGRETSRAMSRT